MTLLSPLFLLGAAAAVLPIVLHFLHRQPEARVKFAAVRLLRHAPVEDTRRRRLREWLLLALRVSALLLLALAFARPFLASGAAGTAGVTVVALDTSLSMTGQFPRARQLARDAISRSPAGDRVGVVTFADGPRSVAAPSTDRALALAAIESAAPGFGATRYTAAFRAADQMIGSVQGRNATIVMITDLQASGWDAGDRAGVPEATRVEVLDAGAMPPNLSVTSVRAELDHVVATIRNTGSAVRDARARLAVDGRDVSEASVSVAAGGAADVVLPGARGVSASVSVDDSSGIQGDNVRYLVLDNAGRPSILFVTTNGDPGRDAFYAQQAAIAEGPSLRFEAAGVGAGELSGWDSARLSRASAVVLMSTQGLDARGRALLADYVRRGGGMFVAAGLDVAGDIVEEILGSGLSMAAPATDARPPDVRHFAPADLRHPVFQAFESQAAALGLVSFRQIVLLSGKPCTVLAGFTSGEAALLDCSVGDGRALLFASDLDNRWNDFPLRSTFVPFVQESLRYLAGTRARGADVLVGDVPAGVQPVPGVVTPASTGAPNESRPLAVNVDPRESDPERLSAGEFQAAITRLTVEGREEFRLQSSQQESRQHLWVYALMAVMALLVAESVVAARAA